MTMLALILLLVCYEQVSYGYNLVEPNSYDLVDGGDYHLNVTYCPFELNDTWTFTGRCWCYYNTGTGASDCSIPGPTLVMYNGSSFSLTVHNDMTGSDYCETCHNEPKDPDVTNLHTHGLHVSGEEDNPLIHINPGESNTYSINIPVDHYPGTHWYHSHWHGAVAFQVGSGLFGALIVKNTEEASLFDRKLVDMKTHLLASHWVWAYTESNCDCDNDDTGSYVYVSGEFTVFPLCTNWCSMESSQREASGGTYDLTALNGASVNEQHYWMVNGQVNPTIDDSWYAGEWRILQFVCGMTEHYLQIEFDDSYDCSYYLLSRDGIYFKDGHRDLCSSPYSCMLLVPPGGRADLAMKCDSADNYQFYLSETDVFHWMGDFPRGDDGISIFNIEIIADDGSDFVTSLPSDYPVYPHYLESLLDEDNEQVDIYGPVNTNCTCHDYSYDTDNSDVEPEITFEFEQCGFEFQVIEVQPRLFGINNQEFNDSFSQYYVNKNEIYEFYVGSNSHPLHQHVNPFQVTHNVGNGMLAEKGDWVDTLGAANNFTMRTITLDYTGHVILHCHHVLHEDEGMMGYYTIVDNVDNGSYCAEHDTTGGGGDDTTNDCGGTGTAPGGGGSGPAMGGDLPSLPCPTTMPTDDPNNNGTNNGNNGDDAYSNTKFDGKFLLFLCLLMTLSHLL